MTYLLFALIAIVLGIDAYLTYDLEKETHRWFVDVGVEVCDLQKRLARLEAKVTELRQAQQHPPDSDEAQLWELQKRFTMVPIVGDLRISDPEPEEETDQ